MSNQTTKSLINALADELTPVKPLAHPLVRIAPWFVSVTVYFCGVVEHIGLRHDLNDKMTLSSSYIFEMSAALALFISAGLSAAWLCVPDMREKRWMIAVTFSIAGMFFLWCAVRGFVEGMHMEGFYITQCLDEVGHCFVDGILLGFVPAVFILFITRKGKTTQPRMLAVMSLLSVTALGYMGLRVTCALDTVGHSALYHLAPFVMAGVLLSSLARRIYKW